MFHVEGKERIGKERKSRIGETDLESILENSDVVSNPSLLTGFNEEIPKDIFYTNLPNDRYKWIFLFCFVFIFLIFSYPVFNCSSL